MPGGESAVSSVSLVFDPRINNRTHREIIVLDGRVAFVGGSGIADHWLYGVGGQPAWRDTMFRVEGPVRPGDSRGFC